MKLSVCIVAYNHENYIEECMEHILDQKVDFSYEILVGNDCSTDGTAEVLKKYEACAAIINREENYGLSRNVYELLLKAKGEYVFLIAGDDYLSRDNVLQEHVDFLDRHPEYYMISGWNYLLDVETGEVRSCRYEQEPMDYEMLDFLKTGNIPCAEGTMRNTFSEDKDHNQYMALGAKNNEEMKIWTYILSKGKIYIQPDRFYIYRYVKEEGASNYNATHTMLDIFNDYYEDLNLLRREFRNIYNFKPTIMHKCNQFCIMYSETIGNMLKFWCCLKLVDKWDLLCYKIYLKTHGYEDPKRWSRRDYLLK